MAKLSSMEGIEDISARAKGRVSRVSWILLLLSSLILLDAVVNEDIFGACMSLFSVVVCVTGLKSFENRATQALSFFWIASAIHAAFLLYDSIGFFEEAFLPHEEDHYVPEMDQDTRSKYGKKYGNKKHHDHEDVDEHPAETVELAVLAFLILAQAILSCLNAVFGKQYLDSCCVRVSPRVQASPRTILVRPRAGQSSVTPASTTAGAGRAGSAAGGAGGLARSRMPSAASARAQQRGRSAANSNSSSGGDDDAEKWGRRRSSSAHSRSQSGSHSESSSARRGSNSSKRRGSRRTIDATRDHLATTSSAAAADAGSSLFTHDMLKTPGSMMSGVSVGHGGAGGFLPITQGIPLVQLELPQQQQTQTQLLPPMKNGKFVAPVATAGGGAASFLAPLGAGASAVKLRMCSSCGTGARTPFCGHCGKKMPGAGR